MCLYSPSIWSSSSGFFHDTISVQSLSRVQLFATPWTAARRGSLSHYRLPEIVQTHGRVSDAIQPSHPLSSPSPAFNLSQHQTLFQKVSSSHQVAKVLDRAFGHDALEMS